MIACPTDTTERTEPHTAPFGRGGDQCPPRTCDHDGAPNRVFVLGTLHRPNRPGIAEELSRLAHHVGLTEEAASGHRFRDMYLRQQLLLAEKRQIRILQQWIGGMGTLVTSWLSVLPENRVWTFSGVCPSAGDVSAATRTMLRRAGADIWWEAATTDHAPHTGLRLLHQHILLSLPGCVPLSALEDVSDRFALAFGGAAEVLPGACLTIVGSR